MVMFVVRILRTPFATGHGIMDLQVVLEGGLGLHALDLPM